MNGKKSYFNINAYKKRINLEKEANSSLKSALLSESITQNLIKN